MSEISPNISSNESRPLSPHIQIYRWTLTMLLSILHRATGLALYAGTILLVWWLSAAATGPAAYGVLETHASAWYGRLVLFAYTWALFHHMCGGLRHFIWDTGRGYELRTVEIIAWVSTLIPPVLTLLAWGLAYKMSGAYKMLGAF